VTNKPCVQKTNNLKYDQFEHCTREGKGHGEQYLYYSVVDLEGVWSGVWSEGSNVPHSS